LANVNIIYPDSPQICYLIAIQNVFLTELCFYGHWYRLILLG